ncbi:MAG: tetratricopeptide repeat protein, partial [Candidatus Heimdallarchaeaceae archaeon]
QRGLLAQVVEKLQDSIKVYLKHEDHLKAVDIICEMIPFQTVIGQLDEAQKYASTALEIANKTKDDYSLFSAYKAKGEVQSKLGRFSEAIENLLKALEYSNKIRGLDVIALAATYFSLGHTHMLNQQQKEAIEYFTQAGKTADPNLTPLIIAKSHLFIGESYFVMLDFEKAVEELEKSAKMLESMNQFPDLIVNFDFLGKAYESTGKLEKAIEAYGRGISFSEENQIPHKLEHLTVSLKYAKENLFKLKKEKGEETLDDKRNRKLIEETERKFKLVQMKFKLDEYMNILNILFNLYRKSIEYQGKAISIIHDKIRIAEASKNHLHHTIGLFQLGLLQFRLAHFDQSNKTLTEAQQFAREHHTIEDLSRIQFYLHVLTLPRSVGPENIIYADAEKNTIISDKEETTKIFEENERKRFENYIREDARSCIRAGKIYNNRKKKKIAKRLFTKAKELFSEIDDKEGIAEAEKHFISI